MKKYFKYVVAVILVLISVFMAKAHNTDTGCNIGNEIYPNETGGTNAGGYPTYYGTSPITIRWYDQDPNCGIRDNKISKRSNDNDKCEVIGKNWGIVYVYNAKDNNCAPVALPLDDYTWFILLGTAAVGSHLIYKKGIAAA